MEGADCTGRIGFRGCGRDQGFPITLDLRLEYERITPEE